MVVNSTSHTEQHFHHHHHTSIPVVNDEPIIIHQQDQQLAVRKMPPSPTSLPPRRLETIECSKENFCSVTGILRLLIIVIFSQIYSLLNRNFNLN
jgi:hypothetical protein